APHAVSAAATWLIACSSRASRVTCRGTVLNTSSPASQHAGNAHITLLGAMRAMSFATDALELAAALDVALAEPEAEARW
ncbi:hypothetical protein, partial [Escherichia coli]|uniref:hypothetical protein n=1 Tax=Escherichia coli TaxID=562 RepID=UPI001932DB20